MEMLGGTALRLSETGMCGIKLCTMAGQSLSRRMPWDTEQEHPHPATVWQPKGSTMRQMSISNKPPLKPQRSRSHQATRQPSAAGHHARKGMREPPPSPVHMSSMPSSSENNTDGVARGDRAASTCRVSRVHRNIYLRLQHEGSRLSSSHTGRGARAGLADRGPLRPSLPAGSPGRARGLPPPWRATGLPLGRLLARCLGRFHWGRRRVGHHARHLTRRLDELKGRACRR